MAYTLVDSWKGKEFLHGNVKNKISYKWSFVNYKKDPTNGCVNYVKNNDLGLVSVDSNDKLKIRVSPTVNPNGFRSAVRITTESVDLSKSYNGGVFVIDVDHIPEGNSVWPAFWMFGPNWPSSGEIDIIEQCNSYDFTTSINQVALHTKKGCFLNIHGKLVDCSSPVGATIKFKEENSFGYGFNRNGGGVFVTEWIFNGRIKFWFFPRNKIPSNINDSMEFFDTSILGKPSAVFPESTGYFKNQNLVINTTLCGDWAGKIFTDAKYKTCPEMVADPTNTYSEAYWLINYVKVFTLNQQAKELVSVK